MQRTESVMVRDTGARAKLTSAWTYSRSSSARSKIDDDDLENQNGRILASCAYFGVDDVVCTYIYAYARVAGGV